VTKQREAWIERSGQNERGERERQLEVFEEKSAVSSIPIRNTQFEMFAMVLSSEGREGE